MSPVKVLPVLLRSRVPAPAFVVAKLPVLLTRPLSVSPGTTFEAVTVVGLKVAAPVIDAAPVKSTP